MARSLVIVGFSLARCVNSTSVVGRFDGGGEGERESDALQDGRGGRAVPLGTLLRHRLLGPQGRLQLGLQGELTVTQRETNWELCLF